MKNIFICCTGNTCRSPMAQAILNDIFKKNNITDFNIKSCGINTADGLDATINAIVCLQEIGLDISEHKSSCADLNELNKAEKIFVMTKSHMDYLVANGIDKKNIFVLNIPDPYGQDLSAYRHCRDEIINYFKSVY